MSASSAASVSSFTAASVSSTLARSALASNRALFRFASGVAAAMREENRAEIG
jgi:hypothetical protein